MKKLLTILSLLFSITLVSHSQTLSFTYIFLSQSPDNAISTISPDQTTSLSQKDKLKIFLKPGPNTYIYLFLHDTEGGLSLLFPEKLSDLDCCYTFNKPYFYPQGDDWTGFDETNGTEQFILIVTCTRLKKLEQLTNIYLEKLSIYWRDPVKKGTEQALTKARHKVLDHIRKVRLEHSDFTTIKEELVIIAGEIRGNDIPDDIEAYKVTTENFYAKT